ncbi:hypothetical protein EFS30_12860 [Levilactobacillus parabrevis]|nr:hypothetical protein [Levilactobacillus parabrevis]MCT4491471.1 hypothetical protein [Levilactobacillus parabrevis]
MIMLVVTNRSNKIRPIEIPIRVEAFPSKKLFKKVTLKKLRKIFIIKTETKPPNSSKRVILRLNFDQLSNREREIIAFTISSIEIIDDLNPGMKKMCR